ncbi:MAG: S8/S53 family peptidase [Bacilli bacterium]|nr:S8/S53 family peptidase [Bacilli bacterium]
MKKKLFLLSGVFCLSLIGVCKLEKYFEDKIVFETSEGPVRMTKNANYKAIINEMTDLENYTIEFMYDPYTPEDFVEEYGNFTLDLFRERSRQYHTSKNLQVIEKLGLEEYVLDMSNYSPYVYLDMQSMKADNIYDFAYELAKNSEVEEVFISEDRIAKTMDIELEPTICSETHAAAEGGKTITYPRIAYDNFPTTCSLTGNGIKIGILDPSSLDVTDDRLSTSNPQVLLDTVSSNDGDHGLSVALVLGTQYGIASEASIFFADSESRSNLLALENLIDAGCDVVNMSFGQFNAYDNVVYDASLEGYIDYMYNSTGIIMVAAAGNGLELVSQGGKVPLPAACANVIAVGSCDSDGYVSTFSSCNTLKKVYSKPDIIAMGNNRNVSGYGCAVGTSYSAPAVTGTIALLLEGNDMLNMKQIVTLLAATANDNVGCVPQVEQYTSSTNNTYEGTITVYNTYDSTTGLYNRSGAGRLDIAQAIAGLSYYQNSSPLNSFILSADGVGSYILGQREAGEGEIITVSIAVSRKATTYWLLGTKYRSEDMPQFRIKAYDSSETLIGHVSINENYFASLKVLNFTVPYDDTYTFYMEVESIEYPSVVKTYCRVF